MLLCYMTTLSKRVQVQVIGGKMLTYETTLKGLRKGTKVILPAPWFMDSRDTMKGKIVSLTSDYTGDCVSIIGKE